LIAVTQGLDTDHRNPASRFLLHVLGAAAEFERALIRERSHAGLKRYRHDYAAGRVGKEVHSRSGKDLAPGRPRRVFDRRRIANLRQMGLSPRQIANQMGLGEGTVRRIIRATPGETSTRQNLTAEIL
jgi:DNA invertase Pin-like site-specific DNA recombinase